MTPVNDAPVAFAESYTLDEDTILDIPAPGLLANDADIDGDALSADLLAGPAHGSLTLSADGSFRYVPAANYAGPDSFTYRAFDGAAYSAAVAVALTIEEAAETVAIDVKPGDNTNTINLRRDRQIAVAILSTAMFDATTQVNIESLHFGATGSEDSLVRDKKGRPKYALQDVNGDGRLDLVVYFDTARTGLASDDTLATLTGALLDGTAFSGTQSVIVRER